MFADNLKVNGHKQANIYTGYFSNIWIPIENKSNGLYPNCNHRIINYSLLKSKYIYQIYVYKLHLRYIKKIYKYHIIINNLCLCILLSIFDILLNFHSTLKAISYSNNFCNGEFKHAII